MTADFGTDSITSASLSLSNGGAPFNFGLGGLQYFSPFSNTICGTVRNFWEAAFTTGGGTVFLDVEPGNPGLIPGTTGVRSSFLGANLNYDCNAFNAASTSSASAGFSPNSTTRSSGAATVLDAVSGSATGSFGAAITALAALSPAQQSAALEKLVPSPSRAVTVVTRDTMTSAMDRISVRLDGLRAANSQFDAQQLASTGAVTGLAAGGAPLKYGVWTKTFVNDNRQGAKDGFAGYSGKGWGLAAGVDREFAPGFIAGLALTYTRSSIDYQDQLAGSDTGIASYQLSGYASKEIGQGYLEGLVAYSVQDYESKRNTVVSGNAKGDYSGEQWGVRIGGGLPYRLGANTVLVPQARLEWNQVQQNGYTEKDSALALHVKGNTADRLRSSLGAQLNHETQWGSLRARPFVRAFWNHDFENNGVDSTANFVGGGAAFRTTGQNLDKDTYSAGIGVSLYASNNFTATISYDHDMGSKYRADTAQAMARWLF